MSIFDSITTLLLCMVCNVGGAGASLVCNVGEAGASSIGSTGVLGFPN
jgi:hypothetical protein